MHETLAIFGWKAISRNASIARLWRLLGANGNQPAQDGRPLIGDFDGDGRVDIALNYRLVTGGGTSGNLQQGVVTVLSLNAPYRPDHRDWPMYYRDTRNSAVGFLPATLSLTKNGTLSCFPGLCNPTRCSPIQYQPGINCAVPAHNRSFAHQRANREALSPSNTHRLFRLDYP